MSTEILEPFSENPPPEKAATLKEWLIYLESLHPTEIELGLARVKSVYENLAISSGLPKVITVGGTNGKGSTAAMIEQVALQHGQSVGVYTSPHLFHYNERVRVNGVAVTDEVLVSGFERIEQARAGVTLTYFEYGTLVSLVVFAEAQLDLVVLEVGLGGRLDAVNIIDSDVAIVTSVDIDHTDWLGDDRESIGYEKAGIARSSKPFVCGELNAPQSMLDHLNVIGAPCLLCGVDFGVTLSVAASEKEVSGYFYQDMQGQTVKVLKTEEPLLHPSNLACALQACALIIPGFSQVIAESVASRVSVLGRQQWLSTTKDGVSNVVIDVGHNPHAAQALISLLNKQSQFDQTYCLIAMMADKDIDAVVDTLAPKIDQWLIADLPGVSRAATAGAIFEKLERKSLPIAGCFNEPGEALSEFVSRLEPESKSLLVVFGSFYTAAAALDYLNPPL